MLDAVASVWVDIYHSVFVSRNTLQQVRPCQIHVCTDEVRAEKMTGVCEQENERLRMCAVQRDLDSCYKKLSQREAELQDRVMWLGEQVRFVRPQGGKMALNKTCEIPAGRPSHTSVARTLRLPRRR
jgi:hypothetical protein